MAAGVTTRAVIFLSLVVFSVGRHYPDFSYALRRLQSRNTWEHLFDGDWTTLFDQQWLQSIAINSTAYHRLEFAINSSGCMSDLITWATSLAKKEMWAVQMLDATGKLPPGVVKGNIQWLGNYRECINGAVPGFSHYCSVAIGGTLQVQQAPVDFRWDFCIPQNCSSSDVISVANLVLPSSLTSQLTAWCVDEVRHYATSTLSNDAIAMICILSVFGAVLVAATVYDLASRRFISCNPLHTNSLYNAEDGDNDPESRITAERSPVFIAADDDQPLILDTPGHNSRCQRHLDVVRKYLLVFSVRVNGLRILSVDCPPKEGTLPALHGIRFLSMSWVMLGHTYFTAIAVASNPADLLDIAKRFSFQAVLNATVSVDTFFLLSGTLVSYLLLRELRRKDGPRHINWLKVVVHRYWRLTPVYMILLGVLTSLFVYFGDGPLWPFTDPTGMLYEPCKDHWWTNLLYVNNLVYPNQQCCSWAWYLADDMQLYLFSLGFIVLLYKNAVIGVICASVPIVVSCITIGVITSLKNYPAGFPDAVETNATVDQMAWVNDIYYPPWCRAGPYFVGVLLGFILFRVNGRLKIHSALVIVFWLLAAACNLSVVYGLYGSANGYVHLSNAVRSLYAAVHRTAWAVGVAWVIFACVTGNGGFVNSLLSWSAFVPLSRLTYAAYLVHPMVMVWYYYSLDTLVYITSATMACIFCFFVLMTYPLAFVVSLAFEAPMIGVMKLAFGEKT